MGSFTVEKGRPSAAVILLFKIIDGAINFPVLLPCILLKYVLDLPVLKIHGTNDGANPFCDRRIRLYNIFCNNLNESKNVILVVSF